MNSLRANSPAKAMQPGEDQFWNQNQGDNIVPEHKQIPGDQSTAQPQSQVIGQVDPNQQQQFAQNQFGQQNAQQQFGQQQYGQPQYAQQPIGGMVNQYQPQMMQSGVSQGLLLDYWVFFLVAWGYTISILATPAKQ